MNQDQEKISPPLNKKDSGFLNSILFLNQLRNITKKTEEKEEIIEPSKFNLIELASYGFPGLATCFSYDPVQKLLAIGTSTGRVVILGCAGIAIRLNISLHHGIKHLKFLSNLPLVICITDLDEVILVDIVNITINEIYESEAQITSIEAFPDSKWILLGTSEGDILILDLVNGSISSHMISHLDYSISFLKIHPDTYYQLLVGCNNGNIYLINLKSGRIMKKFVHKPLQDLPILLKLTALCWAPSGNYFCSGFNNGWILFWDCTNEVEPIVIRTGEQDNIDIGLEMALPEERNAVNGLKWIRFEGSDDTFIYILGGNDIDNQNHLNVIQLNNCDIRVPLNSRSHALTVSNLCNIDLIPANNPWYAGLVDPVALIGLSSKGTIHGFTLNGKEIRFHVLLEWLKCDIIHSKLISQCFPNFHNAIMAHESNILWEKDELDLDFELEGGILQPKQVDHIFYDLVMTSHRDGSVRLWDSSSNILSPVDHLTIWPSQCKRYQNKKLTRLELDPNNGFIVNVLDHNLILVYGFCQAPKCNKHSPSSSKKSEDGENLNTKLNEIESPTNTQDQTENQSQIQILSPPEISPKILDEHNDETPKEEFYIIKLPTPNPNTNIYPMFEIIGHRGQILNTLIKDGFLFANDSYGGFSITNIGLMSLVYFENDISNIPAKFTTRLTGSSQTKDGLNDFEFIVKMDVINQNNDLKLICVTNLTNVYFYILSCKEGFAQIHKGKIFNHLSHDQRPSYISFFSTKISNNPVVTSKESIQTNTKTEENDESEGNEQSNEVESFDQELNPSETNSISSLNSSNASKNVKSVGDNIKSQLTKTLTISSATKKNSKEKLLNKLMSKKPSAPSLGNYATSLGFSTNKENQEASEEMEETSEPIKSNSIPTQLDHNTNTLILSPTHTRSPTIKAHPLSKSSLFDLEHSIVCFESIIMVHSIKDKKLIAEARISDKRGSIIMANHVKNNGDALVCLTSKGFVDVYDLPSLNYIHKSEMALSETYNLNQCTITSDGRIFANINQYELKQFCIYEDHHALASPLCSKIQLFDPTKSCPELPQVEIPWYMALGTITHESVVKTFDKGRASDVKLIDRTKSNRRVRIKKYREVPHPSPLVCGVHTIGSSYSPASSLHSNNKLEDDLEPDDEDSSEQPINNDPPKSGLAAMISQTTDKLLERAEKLATIEDNMRGASEASQDFLAEIRAYNQRQAAKKWYQL